jgi:hypothetical protein
MTSKAATVEEYLAKLPDDRRAALVAVRNVILDNLDPDIEERMSYGMIGYAVPHSVYPAGYHCDPKMPLPVAGLASQKGHMSLYLMSLYGDPKLKEWFETEYLKTGKKLDIGKSCVRFRKLDDLPLALIGKAFKKTNAKAYIRLYEETLRGQRPKSEAKANVKPPTKPKAKSRVAKA